MTVTESVAVAVVLRALGFTSKLGAVRRPRPTEAEVRKAAAVLAGSASKRMQLTYFTESELRSCKLRLAVRP